MRNSKLINHDKYEVFILLCPANLPFPLFIHPWFVCNEKGKLSRWEVLFRANTDKTWGHLHLNSYEPFSGIEVVPFVSKWYWQSTLLNKIEGDLAIEMINFIKMSKENYPYLKDYSLKNTNSNTYAQWILNHFAKSAVNLPWNCIGKNTLKTKRSF